MKFLIIFLKMSVLTLILTNQTKSVGDTITNFMKAINKSIII